MRVEEWRRIFAALVVLPALACGSAEEPRQPSGPAMTGARAPAQPSAEERAPTIERVRIEPEEPIPGGRVRALVEANDRSGGPIRLRYAWTLDGAPLGSDAPEITLERGRKGQALELRVIAGDGAVESPAAHARVVIGNRAPMLSGVTLEPASGLRIGGHVTAVPEASDPDDDALRYEVVWRVNGDAVPGDDLELSTKGLRRGDQIQAQVRASDGSVTTEPATSPTIAIENSAPQIVSRPATQFESGVFRYVVEARDPDGDRNLRYALERAPDGMTIDRFDGTIRWTPGLEQDGAHAVEVAVEDGQGGKTVQRFEVTIARETAAAPPPATAGR